MSDLPLPAAGIRAMVVVWASPHGSHRSQFLAQALGARLQHITLTRRRGRLPAPVRYMAQALITPFVLMRHRPQVIFVQNPPIFGALLVYLWSAITGAQYVIDSHTDALTLPLWQWSLPRHRFLSKRAWVTLVTNRHLCDLLAGWGVPAMVLPDPPLIDVPAAAWPAPASFRAVMVSTASPDEPVGAVIEAASALPDVEMLITGDFDRAPQYQALIRSAPPNARFTGYLPDAQFYGLLQSAHVVLSLTTEDHTFQSGASEAFWLGRPVITSDWPVLREYFGSAAQYVDHTGGSICEALQKVRAELPAYEREVAALRRTRFAEWWEQAHMLVRIITAGGERAQDECF